MLNLWLKENTGDKENRFNGRHVFMAGCKHSLISLPGSNDLVYTVLGLSVYSSVSVCPQTFPLLVTFRSVH